MKYSFIYIIPVCLLAVAVGCTKTKLLTYDLEAKSDIYFDGPSGKDYTYSDTLTYSFAKKDDDLTTDSVKVNVRATGILMPYNREYDLKIDAALSTAVAGKDYQIRGNNLIMPANKALKQPSFDIFRTPDLYGKSVKLVLNLLPNQNFETKTKFGTGNISVTRFVIVIDNMIPKPAYWDANISYLGNYSMDKILLMKKILKLDPFEIYKGALIQNFAKDLQVYLNEQKDAGNIIRELNGMEMVMGPSAQ